MDTQGNLTNNSSLNSSDSQALNIKLENPDELEDIVGNDPVDIKTEIGGDAEIPNKFSEANVASQSSMYQFYSSNKPKTFNCTVCSYQTAHKQNLGRHMTTHDKLSIKKQLFKCDQCPFESHLNSYLQRHLKVHSNKYFKCDHCDFATKYVENLSKHGLKHKSPSECQMYACDECEYQSKDKSGLKRHILTHKRLEEVEHFSCTICSFVTKHQTSYNNHMLKIHNKDKSELFRCQECDFSTYHKMSLKNHVLTHRKPGEVPMYKCPECPYETKNKQFLPNHMKRHLGTVPCPKCKKLICQRGMTMHLKTHEGVDTKKYKCAQCHYTTLYHGNLSRHMKIVHSDKTNIKYKYCSECPFKTFENARLKRHIKEIHSEEAPEFKCDHCPFTSKFNSCLKRHVDTHHINTNPVICPICEKQSANIYTLRIHLKLHKKEEDIKMFQCEHCPFRTRHSRAYKDHLRRDKLADEICCPICCYKTSQDTNLRIHMSVKHKNKLETDKMSKL